MFDKQRGRWIVVERGALAWPAWETPEGEVLSVDTLSRPGASYDEAVKALIELIEARDEEIPVMRAADVDALMSQGKHNVMVARDMGDGSYGWLSLIDTDPEGFLRDWPNLLVVAQPRGLGATADPPIPRPRRLNKADG